MRSIPDRSSPWGQRLWYDAAEFDILMDQLRERTGADSFTAGRGVDVDLVFFKALRTEADYVDLPPGVLGRTNFSPDGRVQVEISRALSDDAERDTVSRRRLRTTLAHECGHVVCHRALYLRDTETLSLFDTDALPPCVKHPPMLCRHEAIAQVSYQGDWWEYQANQCMTSLLLPRELFASSVRRLLSHGGMPSFTEAIRRGDGASMLSQLAHEYDVNPTVILYRLQVLGFVPDQWQPKLLPE